MVLSRIAWLVVGSLGAVASSAERPADFVPTDSATFVANTDEALVPAYDLPPVLDSPIDPMVTAIDAASWRQRIRPIVLSTAKANIYGDMPATADAPLAVALEEATAWPEVSGIREQWELTWSLPGGEVSTRVLIVRPDDATGPMPLFLVLNTRGNQEVSAHPAIMLPENPPRRPEHRGPGSRAHRWPLEEILQKGFGLATVFVGDFAPDNPREFREGVIDKAEVNPNAAPTGALGAWAWGASQVRAFLATQPGIDEAHIAVAGHSRAGKAALWAAATDEAFWLAWSNGSGCAGAALSRRAFGESWGRLTHRYGYWLTPSAREFDQRENDLPIDQHQVLALIAPRPLLVTSATKDLWADPIGEELALRAALPVWEMYPDWYDVAGPTEIQPAGEVTGWAAAGGRTAYHRRIGGHDVTIEDWRQALALARRALPPTDRLRWASYNLAGLNGWHRRRDTPAAQHVGSGEMGRAMRKWDATVIGVQELPRDLALQKELARGLGSEWTLRAPPINAEASTLRTVGIAWRDPRVEWLADRPADPRWPTYWGAVDLRIDGQRWRVHSGKLSPKEGEEARARRFAEMKTLLPALAEDRAELDGRVVVLADLNADLLTPEMQAWADAGWSNALADSAGWDHPTKHDRGETFYRRTLDYVMLPQELGGRIWSGRVLRDGCLGWQGSAAPEPWSDHLPVWVDWIDD